MSESSSVVAASEQPALRAAPSGRVVSIDILRGLAILWVMVFHLYVDMTYHMTGAADLYPLFRDRVSDGKPLAMLTALGELILGHGYLGVSLFMMLSGLSLTMNAYRKGEPDLLRGYAARLRRLVVPYWGGVTLLTGTVAAMALLQMLVDGGSFQDQWWNVRIALIQPVHVQWGDVLWALSVVPWVFRVKLATVPVGSLWFVELLLQYYLMFPFALMLLRRIGPWRFALAGFAITLVTRGIFVPWGLAVTDAGHVSHYLEAMSVFRLSEFFIGMSMGYLLVHRRDEMAEWARSPLDIGGLLVIAVLLIMGGTVFGPKTDTFLVAGDPIVQVGLAVLMLPLLFKAPGRLEVSLLAKALVFLGVISFTALIVDDMMRYMASFLRYEGVSGPPWWFFLWVVYIPVGTLLAYPLAKLFGLLPQQRAAASKRAAEAPPPAVERPELQPAAGG